jgi:hypothetical protein
MGDFIYYVIALGFYNDSLRARYISRYGYRYTKWFLCGRYHPYRKAGVDLTDRTSFEETYPVKDDYKKFDPMNTAFARAASANLCGYSSARGACIGSRGFFEGFPRGFQTTTRSEAQSRKGIGVFAPIFSHFIFNRIRARVRPTPGLDLVPAGNYIKRAVSG